MYTYEHDGKHNTNYNRANQDTSGQQSTVVQRPRMFKFLKKNQQAENKALKTVKSLNPEEQVEKEIDFKWPDDLMAIMNQIEPYK